MRIIRYNSGSDIDVEFLDEHQYIKKNTLYLNFKNGQIKNPYDRTVAKVGYFGVGKYTSERPKGKTTQEYQIWSKMLLRCYDPKYQKMYPAYYGIVEVCDEWLNYQNFAEWYTSNYYEIDERLHIDKDILKPNCKLYSPENCLLVPQRINELFTYKKNNLGLPIGIRKTKNGRFSVGYNTDSLGIFDSLDEAFNVYKYAKESAIEQRTFEYKNVLPKKTFEALLNYKVLIENDVNYKE